VAGVIALAVLAAGTTAWWTLTARGDVQYSLAPIARGAVTRTVSATGVVNPELTIIVGTYVSGVIHQIHCDYNTQVKRGQVCAEIDPRPYQTIVDQAKANLAVARAQLERSKAQLGYATAAFGRAARLIETKAISQDSYDSAKSNYDQARAQISYDEATILQRQAALDAAQVNLDYTRITSPVDGTVVSRNVTIGQTVAASFQTPTLFLIATDLTKMTVDTNVSESDIGSIEFGDRATFTVDAFPRRTFQGVVSQIRQSPQTVQNVVTYDVVLDVNNSDLALKPGMTAATRLVIDERADVMFVPNQALRYSPGGLSGSRGRQAQVWVLRNQQPLAVPVVIGLEGDSATEIVSDELNAGDRVIVGERAASGNKAAAKPKLRF
jgi:HlyD family secretion protein